MNKENILAVAEAIEKHSIPDLGFNMGNFIFTPSPWYDDKSGHNCGTIACIAGWTVAVKLHGDVKAARQIARTAEAAPFLGLDERTAERLFYPTGDMWEATPSQAVAVLRHLAETGIVDWSVASKALADAVGE